MLDLYGCHLQNFLKAKELVAEQDSCFPRAGQFSDAKDRLWKVYSELGLPHPAVKSAAVELSYTRAAVDLLLYSLVPPPHLQSHTGRFVVGELITCNVLLPFFSKLSDPDWLNVLLVQVFTSHSLLVAEPLESLSTQPALHPQSEIPPATSSAPLAQSDVPQQEEDATTPRSVEQMLASSPVSSVVDTEITSDTDTIEDKLDSVGYDAVDSELYCPRNNMDEEEPSRPFLRPYIRPGKSNPFYQEYDSDLHSPLANYKRDSLDSLAMDGQDGSQSDLLVECAMPTNGLDLDLDVYSGLVDEMCPKVLLNSQPLDQLDGCNLSCLQPLQGSPDFNHICDKEGSPVSVNPTRELLLGLEQMGTGGPNELTSASPLLVSSSPCPSFSFEPLSSPEGPVLIQNLRITGTITANEHRGTGSHPYTLYTIKVGSLFLR